MPHLSILSLAVPALRFSTALGVEVVSPEKSSESHEHLLFTSSKPKGWIFWEAKSFTNHLLCRVDCRRIDGGGSRFPESRACSGCPAFATCFSRDALGEVKGVAPKFQTGHKMSQTRNLEIGASHPCVTHHILLFFLCDWMIWSSDITKNWDTIRPSILLSVYLSNSLSVHPSSHPCMHAMHKQCNSM